MKNKEEKEEEITTAKLLAVVPPLIINKMEFNEIVYPIIKEE